MHYNGLKTNKPTSFEYHAPSFSSNPHSLQDQNSDDVDLSWLVVGAQSIDNQ